MRSHEHWEKFWLGQTPDSPKEMAPEDFARAIQRDTLEAAAALCEQDIPVSPEHANGLLGVRESAGWAHARAIRALMPEGPDRAPPPEMISDELLDAFMAIAARKWSPADRLAALEEMLSEGRITEAQFKRQIQA